MKILKIICGFSPFLLGVDIILIFGLQKKVCNARSNFEREVYNK